MARTAGIMFGIKTFGDFYAMLIEDFDDFVKEPSSTRRALHCANQLYKWVWGDWLKEDRETRERLGIDKKKDAFRRWIGRQSLWFDFIDALANGTKHFRPELDFQTARIGGYGDGPYGIGPYGQPYLVIDCGEDAAEHRLLPAGFLLEVVVRF